MKKIILFLSLAIVAAISVQARSSQFTKRGVAPLYWMGYEQPYITDVALTEDRYEKNMNWFAATMLPYGYNMFCTDGWIEGAGSTVNSNGYITRYNSAWKHDFAYWMERAHSLGLDLGVYYNPLWISSDVVNKGCTVKGRSNVRVSTLRGGKDFNGALWWCDTEKDGAEEYIKGYVRHFINLGFKFLRCDFLRDYENAYGTEKYAQALKWISEEAGDDIIVSLVMPNSYNKNKTENPYGDMFRVSADCFRGGWDFISNRRRGQHNGGWPQWENLFDGFVYFSTISRSTTIMDGDFVRLNTLVPQIYAIGSSFETDTKYGIAIPRQEGKNVFCFEGLVSRPTDTKCLRFTLGTGDVNTLQCLEPATTGANVNVADGKTYPMRLCSKAEGTMKNTYWNFSASSYGYKRLLMDVDNLTLKVLGIKNLYLNGVAMQQGSSNYIFTLETDLHYTADDLYPLYFTTQWEEGAPLQPLMNRCMGIPAEADGHYLVTFNTRTLEVTVTETPDAVEKIDDDTHRSSNEIYDLQGRRVAQPQQRGIYIVGGKKVLR